MTNRYCKLKINLSQIAIPYLNSSINLFLYFSLSGEDLGLADFFVSNDGELELFDIFFLRSAIRVKKGKYHSNSVSTFTFNASSIPYIKALTNLTSSC